MIHAVVISHLKGKDELTITVVDKHDEKAFANIKANNPGITRIHNEGDGRTVDYAVLEILRRIDFSPNHHVKSVTPSFTDAYGNCHWYVYYTTP